MSETHHTNRWKKVSKRYLSQHFFCEIWLSLGKSVKANATDHIIRIEEGGAIWLEENWMPLSQFWHSRKSTDEQNLGTLNIPYLVTENGKVPKNREDVIRILTEKHKKGMQDYLDGYRSL